MQDTPNFTPPPEVPALTKDERQWAMFCHLAAFAGYLMPFVGNIVGPLVLWLLKREDSAYVDEQGKEAINFQITMTIGFAVAFLLVFIYIGILLLPILAVVDLVLIVMATIKASNGEPWRYPFALRLIK